MIKPISLKEVELIAFVLAQELMTYNEPIPDFKTRFPGRLESCLATPFQKFANKELYSTLVEKAAILFYLMIKNHPFQNGNKRIAITTLLVFLYKNHKWLRVDPYLFYQFAVGVAKSPPKEKEKILISIQKFIEKYLIDREKR